MTQLQLDWSAPTVRLNPTAPRDQLKSLQRKCWQVLERLVEGPASNVELHRIIGGTRNAAPRVGDLRPWLRRATGRSPWDKTADPIPSDKRPEGIAIYRLAPWAVDAARELLARRRKTEAA